VTLSKREKFIGVGVAAVVGLFALDRVLVGPLLAQREDLLARIDKAELDLRQAENLIRSKPILDRQLSDNISRGLARDQSEAASQLLNSLNEWAQEAGLSLATLKPAGAAQAVIKPGGRPGEQEKAFLKLTCRATGTGRMSQVGRFIWKIQTASIPVRITDLTVNSRKEGSDDLEVNIGVSTIFLAPEAAAKVASQAASPGGAGPSAPGGRAMPTTGATRPATQRQEARQ
jgi:hypothetical protein